MADSSITSRPYTGLPQNTADDRARARELYKYFQPPEKIEPIDTVLTAHSQLAAWRLSAERAMISLIDEETQYFVAESTKTVHLDDAERYEDPEDAIWAGCVRVPKAGRLCEHTISTPPPPDGGPACFEVLDLSKDERFNHLGFIAGPPHFRYYAGVPLRTRRGINIGSIYILDSKLRAPLTRNEKHFLGVMADNVIQHLEMSRDKKDRQRSFRMNECLSAYVDPASEGTRRRRRNSNDSLSAGTDSETDSRRTTDSDHRIEVITRAAELLREAMDIEEGGGGVLYLDTSLEDAPSRQPSLGPDHPSTCSSTGSPVHHDSSWQQQRAERPSALTAKGIQLSNLEAEKKHTGGTEILVHTYQPVSTPSKQAEFLPFTPEELLKLIRRHPRGRMFTYDQQGQEISDYSDSESTINGRSRSKKRQHKIAADSATLRGHFPAARQIMFTPIWDSTTSRSAACFIYNYSEYRNFTHQLEFLNCVTFNNCVDTELLRLSNLKAAEQKNNFIGSISHELRSPLHGILASCEFLRDTNCTSFQQSLVKTAESCARTLLDTVNMVLDYSKINAFERDKSDNAASCHVISAKSQHHKALQTDLNAQRKIDLAKLTEEVVEGVATGHTFTDPYTQTAHQDVNTNCENSANRSLGPRRPDVELIIEISEQDWTYWCEPGSIRRVVMNIVGNALKYTQSGFVHVKLDTQSDEPGSAEYGVLTVTDSGQGISAAYLKDKLYKPFAQESNQAPGVGLGLSLIKSIVDNIGGHIDVVSTVGIGTKVSVKFPLIREPLQDRNSNTIAERITDTIKATTTDCTNRISQNGALAGKASVSVYLPVERRATSDLEEASQLLRGTLMSYLSRWSRGPVREWQEESTADIIVVEETAVDDLFRRSPQLSTPRCQTMVLVLCGTGAANFSTRKNVESIRHPVGPHKLAKGLQACLNRSKAASLELTPIESMISATLRLKVDQTLQDDTTTQQDPQRPMKDQIDHIKNVTVSTTLLELPDTTRTTKTTATPFDLSSHTRRVLLVDDNAINLRLLQVGMKKRGYLSTSTASDGLQAVNTYRTLLHSSPPAPPDIILMDLSMPIMDGFTATRKIREIETKHNSTLDPNEKPLHALIIALTGLASVRDQKEAFTAGVDSYVMKPVSFAKLATLLQEWTMGETAAVVVDEC